MQPLTSRMGTQPAQYQQIKNTEMRENKVQLQTQKIASTRPSPMTEDVASELEMKSGHMWKCVERKKGPYEGFIYGYEIENKYYDIETWELKNKEIYPATEATFDSVKSLLIHCVTWNEMQRSKFLKALGFELAYHRSDRNIFYMPDREAILSLWKNAQEMRAHEVETISEKLKPIHSEFHQFRKKDQKFVREFKNHYRDDENFSFSRLAFQLIKNEWKDDWNNNCINDFMRQFSGFIYESIVGNDIQDEEAWKKWNEKRDNFLVEYLINKHALVDFFEDHFWIQSTSFIYELIKSHDNPETFAEQLKERLLLPDIKIASSDGIASDVEFILCYLENDALLSKENESFHDGEAHLLNTILNISNVWDKSYKEEKERLVKLISELFYKIQSMKETILSQKENPLEISERDIEKIEFCLALAVDIVSASSHVNHGAGGTADFNSKTFSNLIEMFFSESEEYDTLNIDAWKRRFPNEELDISRLTKIWKAIIGESL